MERKLVMFFIGAGFKSINPTPNPEVDGICFLLWMEEVKFWLREYHQIYAWVKPSHVASESTFIPKIDFIGRGAISINTKYDTYEDALMNSLYEVRKYI